MWLKGEPLHLTSTNHPGSLTTTRGLAPSIHSHFLSAPRLHSSIAFLRLKTKGMERLEGEGELMPTPVCSWYHSVCVCVTTAVHGCPLQALPSHYKLKISPFYTVIIEKSLKRPVFTRARCTRPSLTLFRLIWGEAICLMSSHLQSFSVCLWWHDLYIVLSPPLPPPPRPPKLV